MNARDAVLGPLPRRARLMEARRHGPLPSLPQPPRAHASLLRVTLRLSKWARVFLWFAAIRIIDAARGKRGPKAWGPRLRQVFETVGGTAVKVGQQLASRVDMLPFEVCQELGALMDDVPPFPVEHAIERIEATTGRPLHETFRKLDPKPVGSASIACVFQGELLDGTHVAIKVQRAESRDQFAADLQCMNWFTRMGEQLTFVRDGQLDNLRVALQEMFLEELDFTQEARYQRLFRKATKSDRIRNVTAPRVFQELSSRDVLVTEFVHGIPCSEVLGAADTGDPALLDYLESLGIDRLEVGKELFHLSQWGKFERPFFHADPHAGNIVIQPQGKIMMLDFGACGISTSESKELQLEMNACLVATDSFAMADAGVSLLSPLPHVDVDDLRLRFQRVFDPFVLASEDPEAEWWESTSAPLWLQFMRISRESNVPVNLDAIRMARSTLLFESVATRLDPDLGVKEYKRYLREAARRRARRSEKDRNKDGSGASGLLGSARRLVRIVREAVRQFGMAESPFIEYQRLRDRGAFVAQEGLRTIALVGMLVGIATLSRLYFGGAPYDISDAIVSVLGHPVVLAGVTVLLVIALRRTHMRLTDIDPL